MIAGTELIGPRVGKGDQTRHPVRLCLYQNKHRPHRQRHHQGETEQTHTAEEQHRSSSAHHYNGGTEVGLHQQQAGHRQQHDERLEEAHPALADFLLLTHQIACEVDHHKHLGDFRRLDVEEAETDPPHGAVYLTADTRDQHHHQQTECTDQQQPAQALPCRNRHHHGHDARAQAEHDVKQVPDHVVQGVARLQGGNFGRCRSDHHQPKTEQGQATGQQREIEVDATARDQRRRIRLEDAEDHASTSTARANSWPRSS